MDAPDRLLAFNAGSSSLKAELFSRETQWQSHFRVVVEEIGREHVTVRVAGEARRTISGRGDHGAAAGLVLDRVIGTAGGSAVKQRSIVTAHRIVHGGDVFSEPARVTPEALAQLESLTPLAPLHNPPAVDVLRAVRARLDGASAVAVFDTAFFRDLPQAARAYAIPSRWRSDGAFKRFGFHGIAHEYLYRRSAVLTGGRAVRVITLQLGNGCSAAALRDGRPVETSMGFTPLEGLMMGTRAGDVDAGILLHLAHGGASWSELDSALNREAGLLGLSEQTSDMAELIELEAQGEPRAALAIDTFCHRARKYVGAYTAVLGGLDTLVFGGGIGENAARVRSRICADFEWLGLTLDERANAAASSSERVVSRASSSVAVLVVPVREERAIARHACACLGIDSTGLEY
jgi:acetate kinase